MLIICMLAASVVAAFISLRDVLQANGDCYDIVPGNNSLNVFFFVVFRVITHYVLMALTLYVFWVRRRAFKRGHTTVFHK